MSENDHGAVPPSEGGHQAPSGQQPVPPGDSAPQYAQGQRIPAPEAGQPGQYSQQAQYPQPVPGQAQQPGPYQQQAPYAGQQGFQPFQNNAPQYRKKAAGLLSPADWAQSAIVAGITYLGMLLVAVVVTAVFATVLSSDVDGLFSGYASGFTGLIKDRVSGYLFFALVVQLVAMAQGGTFRASFAETGGSDVDTASATAHLIPLLITAAGLVLLWFGSRFVARRSLRRGASVTTRSIWISALVTAVVLAVLTILLAVAFAGRSTIEDDYSSVRLHFWAFSWHLFVYPVVFGTLVGVWGRRSVMAPMPNSFSDRIHEFLPGLGTAGKAVGIYFGGLAVVVGVVSAVVVGVKAAASAAFALLFFAPALVVDFLSMGHFGGVVTRYGRRGDIDGDTYFLAGQFARNASHWPMLIWIGVVLGVVLLAFAWAGRRPQLNNAGSWFVMPLVFALLGVLVVWSGAVRFTGSASGSDSARTTVAAMGPAWWVPSMFLLWGLVVELLARFAVPAVAGGLKGRARALLLGSPALLAFTPSHRFNNPAAAQAPAPRGQPFAPQQDPFAPGAGSPQAPNAQQNGTSVPTASAGQAAQDPFLPEGSTSFAPGAESPEWFPASEQPMAPVQQNPDAPAVSGSTAAPVVPAEQVTAQSPGRQDGFTDPNATQPLTAPASVPPQQYAPSTQWRQPEQPGQGQYAQPQYAQPAGASGPYAGQQTAQQPGQPAQFASLNDSRAPMDPRAKKRVKLWSFVVGGLVLLLILALVGIKVVNATVFSPEKTVSAYFDAVKNGDADQATSTIDPNVSSDQRGLLTNEIYQAADKKISDYDVKDVAKSDDGETADATVEVTQDQKTSEVHVGLRKAASTLGVVQWEIDPDQGGGLYKTVSLQVPDGVSTVKVNGQDVSVPDSSSSSASASSDSSSSSSSSSSGHSVDFTVLPGEYSFEAPQGGKYLSYGDGQKADAMVDSSDTPQAAFHQQLTDQAKQDAAQAAKDKLDECVQQKAFDLKACGIESNYSGSDYRNPSWKVDEYPEYELSNNSYTSYGYGQNGEVDPNESLYITPKDSGKAKLTYQYKGFDDDWEDEDTTESISSGFPVKITADQITVEDVDSSQ